MKASALKAPFPWFGGKTRAAHLVWERLGDVPNYVEPFFGSGAVLLNRPHAPGIETVNDLDCMVANFWRALQHDPEAVARYADHPVNEADQHARHLWLCSQAAFRERMKVDPDHYDAKIAGWWVWGQCIWIGAGWCANQFADGNARKGVHWQLPYLRGAGMGVHRKLPHLRDAGAGVHQKANMGSGLYAYMEELAARLRRVRVACGDWTRVLGPSVTEKQGVTGVFLDPPYSAEVRDDALYACEDGAVAEQVREWAIANGDNPRLRIALCGYEEEHAMPERWECVEWKAGGGYGSQSSGRGRENATRERIWFSPHCLGSQRPMFVEMLFAQDGYVMRGMADEDSGV